MRGMLGKEAEGKSDAEVKRLYDAKMKAYTAQGAKAQAGGGWSLSDKQRADMDAGDAQMKAATGKSMKDLEKMNDRELEALGRDMEKRYGGAAR
jgi:hypothetical protein